ncbi:MAG: hypothetical protein IJ586_00230 [Alloprevotella sp.]|nr:hypothetical protein [Alloprevotella sp.]
MDWTRSMRQVPRYFRVNPASWLDAEPLDTVTSCKTTRERDSEVRESASLSFDGMLDEEFWVRCYVDCTQDGTTERVPIGTWLVQTPRRTIGTVSDVSAVAYSSLHPLRENHLPVLWHAPAGSNCAELARQVCETYGVAPVLASRSNARLAQNFVAGHKQSALEVARALASAADMDVSVDALGRVTISPVQQSFAMLPQWTFRDDGQSILENGAEEEFDWFDVPNVCEVVSGDLVGRAELPSEEPMSEARRGRRVVLRVENPDELKSGATQELADLVAEMRLREACATERTIRATHGLCPLRAGECAEVDWSAHGLSMRGIVERQEIDVETGMRIASTIKSESGRWDR